MFSILHLVQIWCNRPMKKMVRRKIGEGVRCTSCHLATTHWRQKIWNKRDHCELSLSCRVRRMFTSTYLVGTSQKFLNNCLEANTPFYDVFVTSLWIYKQSPWSLRSKRMWAVLTNRWDKQRRCQSRETAFLPVQIHTCIGQRRREQGLESCDGE